MYHKTCTGVVLIEMNSAFKLLAEFSASTDNKEMQTTRIHLFQKERSINKPKFICASCNKELEFEEIVTRCRRCDNTFSVDKLFIPNDTGGYFCEKCIDIFKDERHTRLLTILTKNINIK